MILGVVMSVLHLCSTWRDAKNTGSSQETNRFGCPKALLCVVTVVSCLLGTSQAVSACSCVPSSPLAELEQSAFVFSGTVIEIVEQGAPEGWSPDSPLLFTRFVVDRSWKGIDGEETTILTWLDNGANCGYSFELGEDYLVYGYIAETVLGVKFETDHSPVDEAGGFRQTDGCSLTKRLSAANEDIETLGEPTFTVIEQTVWGQLKALFRVG